MLAACLGDERPGLRVALGEKPCPFEGLGSRSVKRGEGVENVHVALGSIGNKSRPGFRGDVRASQADPGTPAHKVALVGRKAQQRKRLKRGHTRNATGVSAHRLALSAGDRGDTRRLELLADVLEHASLGNDHAHLVGVHEFVERDRLAAVLSHLGPGLPGRRCGFGQLQVLREIHSDIAENVLHGLRAGLDLSEGLGRLHDERVFGEIERGLRKAHGLDGTRLREADKARACCRSVEEGVGDAAITGKQQLLARKHLDKAQLGQTDEVRVVHKHVRRTQSLGDLRTGAHGIEGAGTQLAHVVGAECSKRIDIATGRLALRHRQLACVPCAIQLLAGRGEVLLAHARLAQVGNENGALHVEQRARTVAVQRLRVLVGKHLIAERPGRHHAQTLDRLWTGGHAKSQATLERGRRILRGAHHHEVGEVATTVEQGAGALKQTPRLAA